MKTFCFIALIHNSCYLILIMIQIYTFPNWMSLDFVPNSSFLNALQIYPIALISPCQSVAYTSALAASPTIASFVAGTFLPLSHSISTISPSNFFSFL